jgi:Polysaccharide pyruvyl transferase
MNNILFSTTCQWNPGDEFIMRGVLNVLRDAGIQFNPLLYNRNPVVNPARAVAGKGYLSFRSSPEADVTENSFDLKRPVPVDYVIFAGTPEWAGGPTVAPLLQFISAQALRCSFIGVGSSEAVVPSELLKSILANNTDVFICRDKLTEEALERYVPVQLLPCPSVLSSNQGRVRRGPGLLGCGVQGTRVLWQRIDGAVQQALYRSYARLAQRLDLEYVAHYVDDLADAPLTNAPVRYSGLSSDYYSIYDQFDLVISPRLHGCGIAAALGIPSICLAHDKRGAAANLFGAVVISSPDEIDAAVFGRDWEARSRDILEMKAQAALKYREAIVPLLARTVPLAARR